MSIQKRPVRNLAARSPLLRKGGPHIKSKTGQRVRTRLSTSDMIDEWQDEVLDDERNKAKEKGADAPFSLPVALSLFFCGHFFPHSSFQFR